MHTSFQQWDVKCTEGQLGTRWRTQLMSVGVQYTLIVIWWNEQHTRKRSLGSTGYGVRGPITWQAILLLPTYWDLVIVNFRRDCRRCALDVHTRSLRSKRRSIRAEGGVLNLDAKGMICDLWFVFTPPSTDTRWFVTFTQLRRLDNATWLSRRAIVLILLIQHALVNLSVHNFYHFAGSSTSLLLFLHHVFHFIQLKCWQAS